MFAVATLVLASTGDAADAAQIPRGDAFARGIDAGSDLDGDGARDLLVFDDGARGKRPCVWLVSGRTGKVLRAIEGHAGSRIVDAAFIGDLDGDKLSDVVVTTIAAHDATSWFAISSVTRKLLWKKSRGADDASLRPIAWVGDVDGDGCREQACIETDVITPVRGPAVIRLVSGRTGETGPTITAEALGEHGVSDAGDLDGDGFAEIAVAFQQKGRAVVGAYSFQRARWLWVVAGGPREAHFGLGVAGGRDFNADGVPDVVVSSPSEGVYVADLELVRDPDQVHVLSGTDGRTIDTRWMAADGDFGSFGESMAFVDDADGDGRPEIVLGDGDDWAFGCAWWISSRVGFPRPITGHTDAWHFGRHVRNAGDLDGDGAGDFIVTQTPACPDQPGALIAISGSQLTCLWKITRKDVELPAPPSEPVTTEPPSAAVEPVPAEVPREPEPRSATPAGTDGEDRQRT